MSSNVIKARVFEKTHGPALVKRRVLAAALDADEILVQAHNEAQRIVSEAREEAQNILDGARADGYESGAREWNAALAESWKSRDEYMAGNEPALIRLAVRIAEKLIGQELRIAPEAVVGVVREALRSASRAKRLTIQVHPSDLILLQQNIASFASASAAREVEVVPNRALAQGDCVVESDIGVIDARLETQLRNMESILAQKTPL